MTRYAAVLREVDVGGINLEMADVATEWCTTRSLRTVEKLVR